jgi:hypothetical protein
LQKQLDAAKKDLKRMAKLLSAAEAELQLWRSGAPCLSTAVITAFSPQFKFCYYLNNFFILSPAQFKIYSYLNNFIFFLLK